MEKQDNKPDLIYDDEIDLYELWQKIWSKKKFIGSIFFLVVAITAAISFLMTPIYRSEAVLMPIAGKPTMPFAEIAAQFLGTPIGESDISAKITAVLKSRTIKERVVNRLNLINELIKKDIENRNPMNVAVEVLEKMVKVSSDKKTGSISLSVENPDPALAQKIAFAYIDELQKILEEKALTLAKANRIFLEKQLQETEKELKNSLRRLVEFQKREKIIFPKEQVKGAFDLYARLVSQKIALQIELKKLESVLSPSSPKLKAIREQLRAIDRQLAKIENSAGISAIPSMETAPEKMSKYTEVFLKVKGLQAKYETLLKLYEQAKLEEQKDRIYVEIIDPPSLPDVPVKPKRMLMITVAGVSALFLGIFLALFMDWLKEARQRHQNA